MGLGYRMRYSPGSAVVVVSPAVPDRDRFASSTICGRSGDREYQRPAVET